MSNDPLYHIDALCGNSNATRELRAGIAAFANEQAKFYLRMHDTSWVDRAIQSPEWARAQLQQCQSAVGHGIQTMESQIAPFCEELANMESKLTGIGRDHIILRMSKKWTALKELGSNAIARHIGILKKESAPFASTSLPPLNEGKTSLEVSFSR